MDRWRTYSSDGALIGMTGRTIEQPVFVDRSENLRIELRRQARRPPRVEPGLQRDRLLGHHGLMQRLELGVIELQRRRAAIAFRADIHRCSGFRVDFTGGHPFVGGPRRRAREALGVPT